MKNISMTTIALASVAVVIFPMVVITEEYQTWQSHCARRNGDLSQAARSVIQHVDDTVEMVHMSLNELDAEVREGEIDGQSQARLLAQMTDLARLSAQIDAFTFVGPDGHVVASSRGVVDPAVNLSDREYFQAAREGKGPAIHIGLPVRSKLGGGWILPISRRHDRLDGGFGGVLVAEVPVSYLTRFLGQFDIGSHGTYLLARSDGIVVVRTMASKTMFGVDFSKSDLFQKWLPKSKSASHEFVSMLDGERRIGSYAQSRHSGLVVQFSFSISEAFWQWMREAVFRWCAALFGGLVGLFALHRWQRESNFRLRREEQLAAREAEFRLLAESSTDLIQRITLDGEIKYVSPASKDIMGVPPEAVLGRNITDGLNEESTQRLKAALELLKQGSATAQVTLYREFGRDTGVWLDVGLSRMPASAGDDSQIVAISRDISRHKAELDELNRLALTDPLTGLANRRHFDRRIADLADVARRKPEAVLSLLIIDIDRFKYYNDTYGHLAGDQCLKAIAKCVKDSLRQGDDVAARFGGEEIAVLLPNTGMANAVRIAERICKRITAARIEHEFNVPWRIATASVGVATIDRDTADVEDLIRRADAALYRAKEAGRNRVIADSAPSQVAA